MTDMMVFHLMASGVLCLFLGVMLFMPNEYSAYEDDDGADHGARPRQKQ